MKIEEQKKFENISLQLASMAEINNTTVLSSTSSIGELIDPAHDEYFRLYDAGVEDGDGDMGVVADEMTNFIVGIWSPYGGADNSSSSGNQSASVTSTNSMAVSNGTADGAGTPFAWAATTAVSDAISSVGSGAASVSDPATASLFPSESDSRYTTDATATALAPAGSYFERYDDRVLNTDDLLQPYTTTGTASGVIAQVATGVESFVTTDGSNYANGDGDAEDIGIALIDSAETGLGADTDYNTVVGFNGGVADVGDPSIGLDVGVGGSDIGANGDLVHHSVAFDSTVKAVVKNDSYRVGFDIGGTEMSADSGGDSVGGEKGGSSFMLLLEDFGEYFYNYNGSTSSGMATMFSGSNITGFSNRTNCTNLTAVFCSDSSEVPPPNYWALVLMVFPVLTLFGNILVIMSVCRERSLQTVTNYFIVSLAIADLLVAVVVMPFAVYALFMGHWALPAFVCDFYIAMDVICSTSSIFNLVAISIDRYIAVTQPIKYAKHRNSRRVCLTILLVWAISTAIGLPIVLGLNHTPNRDPNLCIFYNTDFIVYSSLSSFYIPCTIMVFLYWNIFKALRVRARKQRAARKPHLSELTGGSVIENVAQTRRLAETALDSSRNARSILPDEAATNTASGSNEEEEENAISPDIDDCHVIVNDKSTEFMLATVVEETGNVVAQITSQPQLVVADPNGNHDSGYAPSNVDDVVAGAAADSSPPDSPEPSGTLKRSSVTSTRRNTATDGSPKREAALSVAMKPLSFVRYGVQEAMTLARNDSTLSATSKTSSRKDKKNSQASRFTIYKVHKASKKKREKSSAKKERKATKTLAIVLGVFLICWLPFFTCNIMDAMCAKFEKDCRPGVTAFILTTWLGYINSFVNPVIYTIFNPEFRKAFKKIMHLG